MSSRPGGDLVVLDAHVRTLDPGAPRADAFAVRGGRVAHVGDSAGARAAAPHAPVLDCAGRTVTPGFTDAHTHLAHWARARGRLSLAGVATLAEALARVADAHARLAPGARLTGEDVPPFGAWGALPRREDLDHAAPGRPVVLYARDRHAAWVSSAALAAAAVTRTTPDPPGGVITRDAAGDPTGLLYENALAHVAGVDAADDLEALAGVVERLAELGITSVHDFGDRAAWVALDTLRGQGRLGARIAFGFFGVDPLPDPPALAADEFLWPFALKGFLDGTLGSRTAWMLEPFADGSGTGVERTDRDAVDQLGEAARARGLSLALHAIGDRATRAALDAFARWPEADRRRLRPRVEHAQLIHPDDLGRFAELGVVASMQPVHAVTDRGLAGRLWGARDALGGYAWGQVERAGARLAFGSDVPIEDPDPRSGLWAAVTGGDEAAMQRGPKPERALLLESAFAAFTRGAAWAIGREDSLGILAPGAHADFLVWEEDPWCVPADRLRALPLASTWVGGRRVWPRV